MGKPSSVLILYGVTNPLPGLAEFVCRQGFDCHVVDVADLIQRGQVHHRVGGHENQTCWTLSNKQVLHFPMACLHHPLQLAAIVRACYVDEDAVYALQSWQAYLFYFLSQLSTVFNPIAARALSSTWYYFPRLYQLAQSVGLTTPSYHMTSQPGGLRPDIHWEGFHWVGSLGLPSDWEARAVCAQQAVAVLEQVAGDRMWVLLIGRGCWAVDTSGDKRELPKCLVEKLLKWVSKMAICIVEIGLKQSAQRGWVTYSMHAYPQWQRYHVYRAEYWPTLLHHLML